MNGDSLKPDPQAIELYDLLTTVLEQPVKWLGTPNPNFGGRKPIQLVGTDEQRKIIDLLRAVDRGLF